MSGVLVRRRWWWRIPWERRLTMSLLACIEKGKIFRAYDSNLTSCTRCSVHSYKLSRGGWRQPRRCGSVVLWSCCGGAEVWPHLQVVSRVTNISELFLDKNDFSEDISACDKSNVTCRWWSLIQQHSIDLLVVVMLQMWRTWSRCSFRLQHSINLLVYSGRCRRWWIWGAYSRMLQHSINLLVVGMYRGEGYGIHVLQLSHIIKSWTTLQV